jgi:hypothetical protein
MYNITGKGVWKSEGTTFVYVYFCLEWLFDNFKGYYRHNRDRWTISRNRTNDDHSTTYTKDTHRMPKADLNATSISDKCVYHTWPSILITGAFSQYGAERRQDTLTTKYAWWRLLLSMMNSEEIKWSTIMWGVFYTWNCTQSQPLCCFDLQIMSCTERDVHITSYIAITEASWMALRSVLLLRVPHRTPTSQQVTTLRRKATNLTAFYSQHLIQFHLNPVAQPGNTSTAPI